MGVKFKKATPIPMLPINAVSIWRFTGMSLKKLAYRISGTPQGFGKAHVWGRTGGEHSPRNRDNSNMKPLSGS
jgi:hypothetical protein